MERIYTFEFDNDECLLLRAALESYAGKLLLAGNRKDHRKVLALSLEVQLRDEAAV